MPCRPAKSWTRPRAGFQPSSGTELVSANLIKKIIIAVVGVCLFVWMILLVRILSAATVFSATVL